MPPSEPRETPLAEDLPEESGDELPEPEPGSGTLVFEVEPAERDLRVDQFLSRRRGDISRSYIQHLIDGGQARVDGDLCRRSQRLRPAQVVELDVPPPRAYELRPEDIPIRIVHQDADLVVVDKAAGMVVHPTSHDRSGTLVHALLHHVRDLSGINGVERPGIVHRIDKDTSGLLVVAKHDRAHHHLGAQFRAHSIDRLYVSLCWGRPAPDEATIRTRIGRHPRERIKMGSLPSGGKEAVTHYRVLEDYGPVCMVQCSLDTGRTHQIRVHLSESGHPLVGDPVYGGRDQRRLPADPALRALLAPVRGQMLHAATLGFIHPGTDRYVLFRSTPPPPMLELIRALRRHRGIPEDAAAPWQGPSYSAESSSSPPPVQAGQSS